MMGCGSCLIRLISLNTQLKASNLKLAASLSTPAAAKPTCSIIPLRLSGVAAERNELLLPSTDMALQSKQAAAAWWPDRHYRVTLLTAWYYLYSIVVL
jgi:hypothetical protein